MKRWFKDTVKVTVDEREYTFYTGELEITGRNDQDLRTGAAKLAFLLRLRGRARRAAAFVVSNYERWHAREVQLTISRNERLAEWKSKNHVESTKRERAWKHAIAMANETVESLTALIDGYREKINLLRTHRADQRKELDVSGEIDPVDNAGSPFGERRKRHADRVRK